MECLWQINLLISNFEIKLLIIHQNYRNQCNYLLGYANINENLLDVNYQHRENFIQGPNSVPRPPQQPNVKAGMGKRPLPAGPQTQPGQPHPHPAPPKFHPVNSSPQLPQRNPSVGSQNRPKVPGMHNCSTRYSFYCGFELLAISKQINFDN